MHNCDAQQHRAGQIISPLTLQTVTIAHAYAYVTFKHTEPLRSGTSHYNKGQQFISVCRHHNIQKSSVARLSHVRKTLTVPRMRLRQTAQLRSAGEQLSQQTRCPHGRNTTFTSRSIHTRQVRASRSCRFSSSNICVSVTHTPTATCAVDLSLIILTVTVQSIIISSVTLI